MNKTNLKQAKKEEDAPRLITRTVILLSLISIVPVLIVGISWIYSVNKEKSLEIDLLRQQYIQEQKKQIKKQIYDVKHFIAEFDHTLEANLKKTITSRTLEAYALVQHLYKINKNTKSTHELKKIITDALRPLRYHNGQGYFFIVDTNYIEVLYPIHPEYEGTNLHNLQDARGTRVIRKEVRLALSNGEGFVTDYWPKPDRPADQAYPKLSFIKYFKPLGWIIGTGLYLDDFQAAQKEEVLRRLTKLHFFNQHKNFFLDTLDGVPLIFNGNLVHQQQKSLMEITDPNGVKIYHEYRRAALSAKNKFFYYQWRVPGAKQAEHKISYADHYKKWNWMFGAGIYLERINKKIKKMTLALQKKKEQLFQFQILLLIMSTSIIFIIMHFIITHLAKNLTHFIDEFTAAIDNNQLINTAKFKYQEFKTLASGTNRNITKLRELQKVSEEAKLLQERNARFISLGEMAGGMAHEINNPLAVIKGYLTLLKKEATSTQLPLLDKINMAIERIAAIIGDFKSLSHSTQAMKKSKIELKQFFSQLRPFIEINLKDANINYTAIIPELTIETDPTYLSQILTNLIKNASDAIKDLPERWIKLSIEQQADQLKIVIQDSGKVSNIPNPDNIFEPLVTNKSPGEGTGLGLSISKSMAQKLGGDLKLDQEQQHTTFVLTLPLSS